MTFWSSPAPSSTSGEIHHPAARVLALVGQMDRPRLLQQLEGVVPEAQAQDVALPRQQVVAHADAVHRAPGGAAPSAWATCAASSAIGLPPSSIACSVSSRMRASRRVLLRRSASPRRRGPRRCSRTARRARAGRSRRSARGPRPGPRRCRCEEADHEVGDLHAGVVDVVLDLDARGRGGAGSAPACRRARRCAGGRCGPPCWG